MAEPANLEKSLLGILQSHESDCSHTRGVPANEYKNLIPELVKFIETGHESEYLRGRVEGFERGLKCGMNEPE